MADISVQKKSGTDLSKVWAAAAIVAIVALMAWLLSMQPAADTAVAPVEDEEVAEAAAPTGEAVELSALGTAPDQYVGQTVQTTVTVAAPLGDRGFWAEVPGGNPFLVVVDQAAGDAGWISSGSSASVVGTVEAVDEAALDSWITNMMIQPEARDQAAFATHFLSVTSATAQ